MVGCIFRRKFPRHERPHGPSGAFNRLVICAGREENLFRSLAKSTSTSLTLVVSRRVWSLKEILINVQIMEDVARSPLPSLLWLIKPLSNSLSENKAFFIYWKWLMVDIMANYCFPTLFTSKMNQVEYTAYIYLNR